MKISPSPGAFVLQNYFVENFHQCGQGHHILYAIFSAGQKKLRDKIFANGVGGEFFFLVKFLRGCKSLHAHNILDSV